MFRRVVVVTRLRLRALNRVNTRDFTYDRGYLGLLSNLGPMLGIITCCASAILPFVRRFQNKHEKTGLNETGIVRGSRRQDETIARSQNL